MDLEEETAAEALDGLLRDGRRRLSEDEMEQLRISGGIPAVPADLGPGEFPQEGGLDTVAVSFNKGCYIGQEVMARLKTRGKIRRRLRRVRGKGPPPPPGSRLWRGDRQAGEMRSAVAYPQAGFDFAAWALIAGEQPPVGTQLGLAPGAGGEIELTDP